MFLGILAVLREAMDRVGLLRVLLMVRLHG
jgi:hypothetical protein